MQIIFNQTVVMFILIVTGIICFKTGIITKAGNKELSKLVLSVVNPLVIFMAYQEKEYNSELVKNLLIAFAISLISFIIVIAFAYILIPMKENRNREIERFSVIYSNCGFMGIPLIQAVLGSTGVFYLTAYLTVFNFAIWTHGIILLSGEKNLKNVLKVLYSPVILSIVLGVILFFLNIKLPSIISEALNFIGNLNTPLAMIVAGVTIADTNILNLLKKKRIYYVSIVKLFIIPALITILLALPVLPDIDSEVRIAIIIAVSAPSATMCTLQCIRLGKDSLYASEIFAFTTVFSILSLPLVIQFDQIANNLLK
ncbi:MAG: AEC family transporter [Oscillospiraceae bacterium]|nr:AEC family transporter [Oscillospiraceae bacterium]